MTRGHSADSIVERVWDDQVIVAKEFARMLRVGLRTLYRWAQTGRVPPPVRLGSRTLRWQLSTVKEFLAQQERGCSRP